MLNDGDGVLAGDTGPGPTLEACLEAILLVVDEPVAEVVLAQVLERSRGEVVAALRELAAEYTEQGRGFDLRELEELPDLAPFLPDNVEDFDSEHTGK